MTQQDWKKLKAKLAHKKVIKALRDEHQTILNRLNHAELLEEQCRPLQRRLFEINREIRLLEGRAPGWLEALFGPPKLDSYPDTKYPGTKEK